MSSLQEGLAIEVGFKEYLKEFTESADEDLLAGITELQGTGWKKPGHHLKQGGEWEHVGGCFWWVRAAAGPIRCE